MSTSKVGTGRERTVERRMTDKHKEFAEFIRRAREMRGLSQKKLAKSVNSPQHSCSPQTIGNLETGLSLGRKALVVRIGEVLQVEHPVTFMKLWEDAVRESREATKELGGRHRSEDKPTASRTIESESQTLSPSVNAIRMEPLRTSRPMSSAPRTPSEILAEIERLRIELEASQESLILLPGWEPVHEEMYDYITTDGNIRDSIFDSNDMVDRDTALIGNCYPPGRGMVQIAIARMQAIHILERESSLRNRRRMTGKGFAGDTVHYLQFHCNTRKVMTADEMPYIKPLPPVPFATEADALEAWGKLSAEQQNAIINYY